ncbi:MAG: murein transglycosylase A [Deltaproteobacteria bacterium]|nr:murein transglycosylase A [Deltaproteobacteria bacterium]
MPHIPKLSVPLLCLLLAVTLSACSTGLNREARVPDEALRHVRFFLPDFNDDLPLESLIAALELNSSYLNRLDSNTVFHYGADTFTCGEVLESQKTLIEFLRGNPDPKRLNEYVRRHFRVYRATGRKGNDKVLFTGYFEPLYKGSLSPDEVFRYPLYGVPDDMVRIDLSLFKREFKGKRITARVKGKEVVPYYSRSQIESENVLIGRGLEIAWLKDPVDVAFLHIQGSGSLELPDGDTVTVVYAGANGRPYRSIGRYMFKNGLISREELSMQGIRKFLSENPDRVDEILNANPSYVFFRRLESRPLGSIGVVITPERTLALDARLFPKGALGFVCCEKPLLDNRGGIAGWEDFCRFVVNQDTGGAIKGAGRADLFWGSGPYAETAAGHLKHDGDLYILVGTK